MRATLVAVTLAAATVAHAAPSPLDAELAKIARASGSTVGVYVEHLERHETAGVDATRPFPLASTFKLPLAIVVLRAIERHALPPLDGTVRLLPADMVYWASPLYERMPRGGEVTLRAVLASLLEASDNSAADGLMRLAGGAAAVRRELAALGCDGISIDRNEAELNLDSLGVAHATLPTADELRRLMRGVSEAQHRAALARFRTDPRDHATPRAMARLLVELWRGTPLAPASAAFLRDELARCRTGLHRLRAGLPPGTPVADRTGTCDGPGDGADCANDVAMVTLPSGEHVVIAAYVEDAGGPVAAKERTLAAVGRAVWAYFTRR